MLLLVGISFTLAVFEIDLGCCHNTFFDEYDTYVQSNNQNIELSSHFEKQNDFFKELNDFAASLCSLFSPDIQTDSDPPPQKSVAVTSQKIFLRNSVWRI